MQIQNTFSKLSHLNIIIILPSVFHKKLWLGSEEERKTLAHTIEESHLNKQTNYLSLLN